MHVGWNLLQFTSSFLAILLSWIFLESGELMIFRLAEWISFHVGLLLIWNSLNYTEAEWIKIDK